MPLTDLIAKLGLDITGFQQGISTAQNETTHFADGFTKAIEDVKHDLGGLGDIAASAFKLFTQPAALAVESFAAIGVAAFKAGESLEAAFNKISFSTGATGKALDGLKDDFRAVFAQVPADAGKVGEAIALLNQRLGLSGEALQKLSTQFIELTKRTGEDLPTAIKAGTQAFQVFNIETAKQGEALNFLLGVSQKTGASITEMAATLASAGPVLMQLGLSFETSAALIGQLQKVGPGAEQAMVGLSKAIATLTKDGLPAKDALQQIVDSIKNAEVPIEGTALAIEIFGAKAGPKLAEMMRQGRFEVDALVKSVKEMAPDILASSKATETWTQVWEEFRNKITLLLEPLGIGIVDALKNIAEQVNERLAPALKEAVEWFGKLGPAAQGSVIGIAAIGAEAAGSLQSISAFIQIMKEAAGAGIFAWAASLLSASAAVEALSAAIAAFIGWKLGEWLYANSKLVRDFADAVFGAGTIWDKWAKDISGQTAAMNLAQADLIKTTQALALKLGEMGIVVSRGAGSYEDYAKAVRDAAAAASTGLVTFEAFNKEAGGGSPEDIAARLAAAKASLEAQKKAREEDLANRKKWALETIKVQEETDKKVFELMQAQATALQKSNDSIKAMADDPWNTWNFAKVEAAEIRAKESTDSWATSFGDAVGRYKVYGDQFREDGTRIEEGLFMVKKAFDGFIGPKEIINPGIPADINKLVDLLKTIGPEAQRSADLYSMAIRQINSVSLNQPQKDWDVFTKSVTDFAGKTTEITVPINQMTADLGALGKAVGLEADMAKIGVTSQEALNQKVIQAQGVFDEYNRKRAAGGADYRDGLRIELDLLEKQRAAGQAVNGDMLAQQQNIAKLKQQLGDQNVVLTDSQKEWKKFGDSVKSSFDTLEGALAKAIITGKGFADAFKSFFISIAEDFLKYVIKQSFESLVKYMLGDVKDAVKQLDDAFGGLTKTIGAIFGTAGSAGKSIAGVVGEVPFNAGFNPTLPGGAGGAASTGLLGAATSALGGIAGIATLIVDALSGITQGLQMARLINLTGEIEVTTRGILNEALNRRRDAWDQHLALGQIIRDGFTYLELAINRIVNAFASGSPGPGSGMSSQPIVGPPGPENNWYAPLPGATGPQNVPTGVTDAQGNQQMGWPTAIPGQIITPPVPGLNAPGPDSSQALAAATTFSAAVTDFGVSVQAMRAATDNLTTASDLINSAFVKSLPSGLGGSSDPNLQWGPWITNSQGNPTRLMEGFLGGLAETIVDAKLRAPVATGGGMPRSMAGGVVNYNTFQINVTNDADGRKTAQAIADALALQGLRA